MENPLPHFNDVKETFDLELNDGLAYLKCSPPNREAIRNSLSKLDDLLIDLDGLFIMCEKRGCISQSDKYLFECYSQHWFAVREHMVAALSTHQIISPVDIPVQCSPSSDPSSSESQKSCQSSDKYVKPVESYALSSAPCSSPAHYTMKVPCDYKSAREIQSDNLDKSDSRQHRSKYARPVDPCVLCKQNHRLWHCPMFRMLKPSERLDVVNTHALCHNCFVRSHTTEICGKKSRCSVPECGEKHSMYIHIDGPAKVSSSKHDDRTQYCDYFNECSVSVDQFSQVVTPSKIVCQADPVTLDPSSSSNLADVKVVVSNVSENDQSLISNVSCKLLPMFEDKCKSLLSELNSTNLKLIEHQQALFSSKIDGMAKMLNILNNSLSSFSDLFMKYQSQISPRNNPDAFDHVLSSPFCSAHTDSAFNETMSGVSHSSERIGSAQSYDFTSDFYRANLRQRFSEIT